METILIVRHENKITVQVEGILCESDASVSVWAKRITKQGTHIGRRRVYNFARRDWESRESKNIS